MSEQTQSHRADGLPRAFVVGCQKSGTSWMQALLDAHPEVCSRGEACFGHGLIVPMMKHFQAYNASQRAGELNTFDGEDTLEVILHAIRILQRKWVDASESPERVRVVAEKTPEHAMGLGLLNAVFPHMRLIHIIRDGRDGVISGWHHNLREKGDAFKSRFPTLASYTRYFVEHHWVPYITAAQRWGGEHPDRYLEIQYERVLESPIDHAKRIFTFLGVDTTGSVIEHAVERTSFRTLSGGRDRGETDNASHFRNGTAGGWQNDLDARSVAAFEELGGDLLEELGYQRARSLSM